MKLATTVIDAGGRYGLHPTWKAFSGELKYYLFEPDELESQRLVEKYSKRSNEINISNIALDQFDGKITINQFRNRAMSTSSVRNPVSASFLGDRLPEVEIQNRYEVLSRSVDSFCTENDLEVDFLKLDTEGNEYEILLGAINQIRTNVLGLRVEVTFDYIFEGKKIFGSISDILLQEGFFLLNFDYNGRGDYLNEFVNTDMPYGILTVTDAVFLKRKSIFFGREPQESLEKTVQVLKYSAFCFMNSAPDVAIDVLLSAKRELRLDFSLLRDSKLYKFVDFSLHKNFYSLKWQPGQSISNHAHCYFEIFGMPMKILNEYMESIELNPT